MNAAVLSDLGDSDFEVSQDIEVSKREENGVYFAKALNIGLTQSGVGNNEQDAMNELKELILDHIKHLENLANSEAGSKIFEEVSKYVKRVNKQVQ